MRTFKKGKGRYTILDILSFFSQTSLDTAGVVIRWLNRRGRRPAGPVNEDAKFTKIPIWYCVKLSSICEGISGNNDRTFIGSDWCRPRNAWTGKKKKTKNMANGVVVASQADTAANFFRCYATDFPFNRNDNKSKSLKAKQFVCICCGYHPPHSSNVIICRWRPTRPFFDTIKKKKKKLSSLHFISLVIMNGSLSRNDVS